MHRRECECSRCQCGYGPTESDRTAAVNEERKKHLDKAVAAAALGQLVSREAKALRKQERVIRAQMATEEELADKERARLAAGAPPAGGFAAFLKGGGK